MNSLRWFLASSFLVISGTVWSQDASRADEFRRSVLQNLGLEKLATDPSAAKPGADDAGDEAVLVPSLRGLVLVTSQDQVNAAPIKFAEPKVELRGETIPAEVAAELESYLGKPVSLSLLNQITKAIVRVYRENDQPVVDAYLPEQNITGGVVQLVVVEGKRGDVRVEGAKYSNPDYLARQITIGPGEPLLASVIDRDLNWLNDHPFRRVNLIYEPGDTDGMTDLVLQTQDLNPIRLQTGIANTGLDVTGENEVHFGATWGRVFGTEHLAAYQYSTDIEFDKIDAHSLYYRAPLPWRHRIDVLAAYVTTDTSSSFAGDLLGVGGESSLVSADYVMPLTPILGFKRIDFKLGADFKSTNSDIEFGGDNVFAETAAVLQGRATLEGERPDGWGSTGVALTLAVSPGDLIGNNDDESFDTLRAGASADYITGQATLERTNKLPFGWTFATTGTGQWSNSRLISTEQLLAGGYRTVRGFDENLIRGDLGWVSSAELLAPAFPVLGKFGLDVNDNLQPILFFDAAWLKSVDEMVGEEDQKLSSAGLEFHYRVGKNWSMRAGYGWQLNEEGVSDVEGSGKFHFGATLLY